MKLQLANFPSHSLLILFRPAHSALNNLATSSPHHSDLAPKQIQQSCVIRSVTAVALTYTSGAWNDGEPCERFRTSVPQHKVQVVREWVPNKGKLSEDHKLLSMKL